MTPTSSTLLLLLLFLSNNIVPPIFKNNHKNSLIATAECANACSGHENCDVYSRCTCSTGYSGADCSARTCPSDVAWSDFATADNTAHAAAECSARGLCNRVTGACMCMEGFSGIACQRTTCPNDCNGKGKCMSMKDMAFNTLDSNSQSFAYDAVWDAEKIFGCVCDSGFGGSDCSLFDCPNGDDPLTPGQVNEVQLFKCTADPSQSGTFALYFGGKVSATISASASASVIEAALETIDGIGDLTVSFSESSGTACQTSSVNVVSVTFLEIFGSLSPIVGYIDSLLPVGSTIDVAADGSGFSNSFGVTYTSVKGTKENGACANKGHCDTSLGSCSCFNDNGDTFASSDGYGNAGTRGDCGYAASSITNCPGETLCSGHGTCTAGTLTCVCSDGWIGGNCALRECAKGQSWFAYPSADQAAHDGWAECSDQGICDRSTGSCECTAGFYGNSCQYMACGGGVAVPCSGHGKCLSMRHLSFESQLNGDATNYIYGTDPNSALSWDADRIQGCACDDGYGGYDCSERTCLEGDDPGTYDDNQEVQLLRCRATSGSFKLQFRQKHTVALNYDINQEDLKAALEALDTIYSVGVEFDWNSTHLCTNSTQSNIAKLTFVSPTGDVPNVVAYANSLSITDSANSAGGGVLTFANDGSVLSDRHGVAVNSVVGTGEVEPCSNRGLCDVGTGYCSCFGQWSSSDGEGGAGNLKDCGYRIPSFSMNAVPGAAV